MLISEKLLYFDFFIASVIRQTKEQPVQEQEARKLAHSLGKGVVVVLVLVVVVVVFSSSLFDS